MGTNNDELLHALCDSFGVDDGEKRQELASLIRWFLKFADPDLLKAVLRKYADARIANFRNQGVLVPEGARTLLEERLRAEIGLPGSVAP